MNCPGNFEWSLFLDNELPPAKKEEMEEHLDRCRDCRLLADSLQEENRFIGAALAATPLPLNLEEFIRHRLRSKSRAEIRWLFILIPAAALTGILAVSAAGLWSLLENVFFFAIMLAGGTLFTEAALIIAGLLRQAALASLSGELALPALMVIVFCLTWIKIRLRKGGPAHA
ncbi:MAG: hypothetical protein JL50_09135 [Peptococcaceae bacterium BICA1-7]|nr:MAG: hypothetical protein JL50_09135 [Peptococcaceae bacterium BICA1-7]HBV97225.1 hypothetical protein [Desulfotomaculum sp.]